MRWAGPPISLGVSRNPASLPGAAGGAWKDPVALPGPLSSPSLAAEVDGGGPFCSMATSLEMRAERWARLEGGFVAVDEDESASLTYVLYAMNVCDMHTIGRCSVAIAAGFTFSPANRGVETTRTLSTAQPLTAEQLTLR